MLIKNVVILIIFTGLVSGLVNAKGVEEQRHKRDPVKLLKLLQITDQQSEEFLTILEAQYQEKGQIHEQHRSSREQQRTQIDQLHQETLQRLEPVLSASQMAVFKELVYQRRSERRVKHQGR